MAAATTARATGETKSDETKAAVGDVAVPSEELAALRVAAAATGAAVRELSADVKALSAAVAALQATIPTRAEMAGADDRRVSADAYTAAMVALDKRIERLEQGWQRALPWLSLAVAGLALLAGHLH